MDTSIKPIETRYKGYKFRSRLEARWAVFFDAIGVDWEYEPEGFDLGDGVRYLPDFLVHGVRTLHGDGKKNVDLFIEVKGVMDESDAEKIRRFSDAGNPILVVGRIPDGMNADDLVYSMYRFSCENSTLAPFYNFENVDGDYYGAYPGIDLDGEFTIFGDDSHYLSEMDRTATINAYTAAREARFEYRYA